MTTGIRRAGGVAVATGAALALLTAPAGAAAPLDRGHFHDVGTEDWACWFEPPDESLPPEEWPDPDYVLVHDFDVHVATTFQVRGQSGTPGFHDRVRGTETWTLVGDPSTTADDHVLVHTFADAIRDATVVVESSGPDGTLLITAAGAGNDTFWLDGVRYRDPGHVVWQFRVHHAGTLTDPSDDVGFEFLGFLKESTGLNEAREIDPCGSLGAFLD